VVTNLTISRQIQAFEALVKRTSVACGDNVEIQAEWSRYLCVIAAGILENSIKELYSDFALKKTSAPIAKFIGSTLSPIRSPKTRRFLEIAAAFNSQWETDLDMFVNGEGGLDAIDSIMNQRHLIAHGNYKNSSISMTRIKEYFARAVKVLEFIEKQCNA
jgi:hypothetical protein